MLAHSLSARFLSKAVLGVRHRSPAGDRVATKKDRCARLYRTISSIRLEPNHAVHASPFFPLNKKPSFCPRTPGCNSKRFHILNPLTLSELHPFFGDKRLGIWVGPLLQFFFFFFQKIFRRMGKNKGFVPTLPRIRYMSCFNLTRRSGNWVKAWCIQPLSPEQ